MQQQEGGLAEGDPTAQIPASERQRLRGSMRHSSVLSLIIKGEHQPASGYLSGFRDGWPASRRPHDVSQRRPVRRRARPPVSTAPGEGGRLGRSAQDGVVFAKREMKGG